MRGVFAASATPEGGLRVHDREGFIAYLKSLAGRPLQLAVRLADEQRSLDQNAYLHAEPFKKIAEYTGESVAQVKYDLMGACWGWQESKLTGHLVPVKPSTSKMSKRDCVHFIDWLLPWSLEFFNGDVQIDPPKKWFAENPDAVSEEAE